MYRYDKLYELLKKHGLNKSDLTKELGISSRTIAKLSKGSPLRPSVLKKLSNFFNTPASELFERVPQNYILERLRQEKINSIPGGLYHELQIRMTYNSNHIEGSRLSQEETRYIFETNTIYSSSPIPVRDIIETINHFRAIDYCIDHAEDTLSEDMIKHLHYLIKRGPLDESLPWFPIGDYKAKPNTVGGKHTTPPSKVGKEIRKLLQNYLTTKHITFKDIVEFHYHFESIHPFQDGNGRVGRLIAFKECLKHNITPFMIEDSKKLFYYRGLKEFSREPGFLIDTCLDGQDSIQKLIDLFEVEKEQ